ncbi:hypothetical protein HS1genome_1841 [Sulfodiicoccus acidiphilus]|uniref:DUF72 domain-containing protein n=1 Tax=Sulfodiicoccus acidiphilus TaxID=1670455 RepID=A0A348B5K0_9CREN|nr:DUF72 domain-containing protein [Sulfodiicoccus acidiphilus]BBD73452.1 hypothetical protein HS1genome_1841 [Sulfodiicoccus acidiphilus]GGT93009.1 hypothetical protein GCM10007116_08550 [Sulfodiicoccus acidiphilus]
MGVDVMEVQQTFYDLVSESTATRMRREFPFEFTVKASQVITHEITSPTYRRTKKFVGRPENYGRFKVNRDTERALEYTLKVAKVLNASVVVFQTPPSFHPTEENLRSMKEFSTLLDRSFLYAWEHRGEGWSDELVSRVLSETGFLHAVDPFRRRSLSSLKYYRLHGIGDKEVNYRYRYTEQDFEVLVNALGEDLNYVMFNNVHMIRNALEFKEYLERRHKGSPPVRA